MAPVGGIVTAVNSLLESEPATINTHPESDGEELIFIKLFALFSIISMRDYVALTT